MKNLSIKRTSFFVDLSLLIFIILSMYITQVLLQKSVREEIDKHHYITTTFITEKINQTIESETSLLKLIISTKKKSHLDLNKDLIIKNTKLMANILIVDKFFTIKRIIGNQKTEKLTGLDISSTKFIDYLKTAKTQNKSFYTPYIQSILSGDFVIALIIPKNNYFYICELNVNKISSYLKKAFRELYKFNEFLIVNKKNNQVIYRSSTIYPYWNFHLDINKKDIFILDKERYIFNRKTLKKLNIDLIVLTPEKLFNKTLKVVKTSFLVLLIIIIVFYLIRTLFMYNGIAVPLGKIITSLGTKKKINVKSQFKEWMILEEIYNSSQNFSTSVINESPIMICGISITGETNFINPAGEKISGYLLKEIVGKNWWKTLFPNYKKDCIDRLINNLEQKKTNRYEMILTKMDGTEKVIIWNFIKRIDPKTKNIEIIGFGSDITELKYIEKELRQSVQDFQTLMANIPGISYRCNCDEHWTMKFISEEIETLTGFPSSDFIENRVRSFASIIHPDDRKMVDDQVMAGIKKRKPYTIEYRILAKEKKIIWVYEKGQGVFDINEKLIYLDGVIVDISELKEQEKSIKLFKSAMEMSTAAIGMSTPDGKHWYQNKAFDQMFGKISEDAPTIYVDNSIGRDVFKTIMSGDPWVGEVQMYSADKTILDIFLRAYPVKNEKNQVTNLIGIHTDITDRKKTEKELENARNYISNIINSMPSVLIGVDNQGRVTQWNKIAEQKTGIKASIAHQKNILDVFPSISTHMEKIRESIASKEIKSETKATQQTKEGLIFENLTIYPLVSNGVTGAVIRIDDVTELEKKDEELRQIQKMETIGTLAGGLAHDFNNVLGGIIGTVSIINHKLKIDKNISKKDLSAYINTMDKAGKRATEMVKQLLTLSRKQELSLLPVDLNLSIKNVMKICMNSFDKSIELNPSYLKQPAMVHADPTQIEQILLNICINANHAMTIMRKEGEKMGGRLFIYIEKIKADTPFSKTHHEAKKDIEYWRLTIQDNGIGMDNQTLAKIFDPFFTKKEKGKGTGLGLSMVYSIIKQHSGFIDVYSEKGIGTTFHLYFPVLTKEIDGEEKSLDSNIKYTGSGKILIIDDEKVIRQIARQILEESGYEVIEAEDGKRGIKTFNKSPNDFQLILLDMVMPKKSGKETFIEIKKNHPNVKVILASGFKQDERVQNVIDLGVDAFIQKPYTFDTLAKTVYKVINS